MDAQDRNGEFFIAVPLGATLTRDEARVVAIAMVDASQQINEED